MKSFQREFVSTYKLLVNLKMLLDSLKYLILKTLKQVPISIFFVLLAGYGDR